MLTIREKLHRLFKDTKGATMVEYAILLALILVIAAAMFKALGSTVNRAANDANKSFTAK
jgi:Flp pilus assembly pilin Flp